MGVNDEPDALKFNHGHAIFGFAARVGTKTTKTIAAVNSHSSSHAVDVYLSKADFNDAPGKRKASAFERKPYMKPYLFFTGRVFDVTLLRNP